MFSYLNSSVIVTWWLKLMDMSVLSCKDEKHEDFTDWS